MSMMITKTNIAEIHTAIANGNRAQLIGRRCNRSYKTGTVTVHEHVGQSWTEPEEGSFHIGWVDSSDEVDLLVAELRDTWPSILEDKLAAGLTLAEIVY